MILQILKILALLKHGHILLAKLSLKILALLKNGHRLLAKQRPASIGLTDLKDLTDPTDLSDLKDLLRRFFCCFEGTFLLICL